jgi:tRNA 2-thiouridine synthesizing protein A
LAKIEALSTVAATDNVPTIRIDRVLDVTGLECPLPILKTKVELTRMLPGEVLHVLATDPLAPLDFRAFCIRTQHELVHLIEANERFEFFIRKAQLR